MCVHSKGTHSVKTTNKKVLYETENLCPLISLFMSYVQKPYKSELNG